MNFFCQHSLWVSFNSLPLITLITTKRHAFHFQGFGFSDSPAEGWGGRNLEKPARPSVFLLFFVAQGKKNQLIDVDAVVIFGNKENPRR